MIYWTNKEPRKVIQWNYLMGSNRLMYSNQPIEYNPIILQTFYPKAY